MTRNERELKAVEEEMVRHSTEIQDVWKKAETEDRESSNDERKDVEEHLKAVEQLKVKKHDIEAALKVEQEVKAVSDSLGKADPVSGPRVLPGGDWQDRAIKSIGEVFTDSVGFKDVQQAYKDSGRLPSNTSTGAVSVYQTKGTLLEGPGGGGGASAATVPQVVPGVVEKLFQPLSVADLLLSGQASTNSLRYVVEGTATSGAAGVAEAGLKPESTLGMTTTDEPVKKIATILPISEEMLEDAPAIQSYINGRLTLFVRIEEERQLLRGAGTNEIIGIMPTGNTRGINQYSGAGTATGGRAEILFKAMNGQRGSALVEPGFIVVAPADWEAIRLAKDTAGQYYGGGPFQGPYGAGSNVGASGQVTGPMDSLWNKPVVVTSALGAGTALVGTSSAAQVWRKGGLSVEASNSHNDFFQRNLVAIRAEERLALAVYRPTAFTEVRFL
jgi:HK97 family phage major capsid protein